MKSDAVLFDAQFICVAPCVGAWIEIGRVPIGNESLLVAPCVGAWIEIPVMRYQLSGFLVAPCVGAWIEIADVSADCAETLCRSLRGSVD